MSLKFTLLLLLSLVIRKCVDKISTHVEVCIIERVIIFASFSIVIEIVKTSDVKKVMKLLIFCALLAVAGSLLQVSYLELHLTCCSF